MSSSYEHTEKHTVRSGTGAGAAGGETLGDKASRAWEGVKESVPGTTEYKATHPTTGTGTTGTTGMGGMQGMSSSATGTSTGPHAAANPVTGETHLHSTETGAKVDQAWQDVKSKVPGTTEHKASHPTVL